MIMLLPNKTVLKPNPTLMVFGGREVGSLGGN